MGTHEGWSNYETWAVNLWISNEESLYRFWQDRIGEIRRDHNAAKVALPRTKKVMARVLAEELKAWLDDERPDLGGTVWSDLLSAALSEVDCNEIAEAWLSP